MDIFLNVISSLSDIRLALSILTQLDVRKIIVTHNISGMKLSKADTHEGLVCEVKSVVGDFSTWLDLWVNIDKDPLFWTRTLVNGFCDHFSCEALISYGTSYKPQDSPTPPDCMYIFFSGGRYFKVMIDNENYTPWCRYIDLRFEFPIEEELIVDSLTHALALPNETAVVPYRSSNKQAEYNYYPDIGLFKTRIEIYIPFEVSGSRDLLFAKDDLSIVKDISSFLQCRCLITENPVLHDEDSVIITDPNSSQEILGVSCIT